MPIKRWNIREPDENIVETLAKKTGLSPVLLRILVSRGYRTQEAVEAFIHERHSLTDPFALTDMEKAVERIRRAMDAGERIAVYGDYDCDGIMSTVMLYRYFEAAGVDIAYYIPQRDSEGYGLNKGALERIHAAGVSLVITVDNGISALEEAEYAIALGLDIIVTDHHKPREVLPEALAVVDPHRVDDESGCEYLCGAGVAFKLICALESGESEWVLDVYGDLLAVATVADIVPLVGENRAIVRRGMELLQNTENEGLSALLRACGMGDRVLSCENIVFGLVPRINSAGRFDRVDSAVELFVSEGGDELDELARDINTLNEQRKKVEDKIVAQILERYDGDRDILGRRVIVIHGEGWHHGVVGIVASRMVERFGKPCIVLSVEGEVARGSARSVEGFSIIEAISACGHLLTRYGGHNQAAGMTLPTAQMERFAEEINEWAGKAHPEMPVPVLTLDCLITPRQLSVGDMEAVALMEPFGCGNETPLYYMPGCTLQGIYPIGEGKHLRLRFCRDNTVFYAVYFGVTQQTLPYAVGDTLDLALTADANEWNGEMRVSVKIRDLRPSGIDYDAMYHSEQAYERIMRGEPVEAAGCVPDREDVAVVYRYLRSLGKTTLPDELLYARLRKRISSFCKLKIAGDVMEEMELITRETAGGVCTTTVRQNPRKVNLADSKILQGLERVRAVNCS